MGADKNKNTVQDSAKKPDSTRQLERRPDRHGKKANDRAARALPDGLFLPPFFYAKDSNGRIDDPKAGWKGRACGTTSGERRPWLKEGGKAPSDRCAPPIRPDPAGEVIHYDPGGPLVAGSARVPFP